MVGQRADENGGAGCEVNNFTPIAMWADVGSGHGPRGGRHQCRWATWLPMVGLRADAGGGRGPRGQRLYRTATWADEAAGASCEAASLAMATWPRRPDAGSVR